MKRRQRDTRDNDHRALQDHEDQLVVRQLAVEPLLQLDQPVHAPHEDRRRRHRDAGQEQPPHPRAPQRLEPRVQPPLLPPHLHRELGAQRHERRQRRDLAGEAGDHDVDADVLGVLVVRRRGEAAAGGLQDERDEVAADEEEGVGARADARDVLAVDDDDAAEAEVDGGAEEGRADGEADEVSGRRGLERRGRRGEGGEEKTYSRNGSKGKGLKCSWTRPT